MKGLELSKRFYLEYGAPMLRDEFAQLLPFLAVGLAGSGSECFGYDDELSKDHDFEPGFCIFLPDEQTVDRKSAFALERAYAKLPKEFMGFRRSPLSPVGGNRHGVMRMAEFFEAKTGTPSGELSPDGWLSVPEQALAEATNGEVFWDEFGQFTAVRRRLSYMPEDVRLKKLAGRLLLMGQAGQYNYMRCVTRGETAAAQLALCEFVQSALHACFLLNGKYMPYYKWSFRALRELPRLAALAAPMEQLLCGENGEGQATLKAAVVEEVCRMIAEELKRQDLTRFTGDEAEGHAYSVNDHIADPDIRTRHVLCAV